MKHAYLIIVHEAFPILKVLLSMLDDPRHDFYLHVDRKAEDIFSSAWKLKMKHSSIYILQDREDVSWGDLSQVRAEYKLFEEAVKNGPYSYYHLLSGVDLPLKSPQKIYSFFEKYKGDEFVGYWNDPSHQKDARKKVERYYFFLKYYRNKAHPLHALTSFTRNFLLIVQKCLFIKRHRTIELKKGWNWVSITHEFCQYLLSKKEDTLRAFQHTLCPDEIFLQTILWNSPFRSRIHNMHSQQKGTMRYIDWNRGTPYTWRKEDLDELLKSEACFARKFSLENYEAVELLKEMLEYER